MTDINKIIKNARDVLVGKVPDPQSQIDQITLALIYKFMDAKDKEAVALGLKKIFFKEPFEKYSFTKIMQASNNEEQYELYNKGIEELQNRQDLPQTFTSVFKDAFIPYRDALTLHLFLIEIDKIPTDNTELLGTAFEDLLSIMGSQGDAGQFRTPRHIIDMIVEIVEPKKGEKILDPACGTAGFLISAYNKIIKQDLSISEKEELATNGLIGYDINPNMVKLSNVNLFLHGCQKPNIHLYDTLTEKDFWTDKYDVILANPPFMTPKGGIRPHELFSAINANRSEVLFTYYIAQHLTRNGRAGFIVPEGVVFQTANAYKEMRRILVDENYLYAVISLPNGVFNPYSGVKTSVLILDKALAKKTDKILFVKMHNDGFDLGAQRRPIDKNDIPNIIETVKSFAFNIETETEHEFVDKYGLSIVASKEQIRQNDYVLVGDRYKERENVSLIYDLVELGEICDKIQNGINVKQIDEEGKYKVTRIQTIADGKVNLDKTKWTNDEPSEEWFLRSGDILISHINSYEHLAKSAIFPNTKEKVIHGINLIRLQPNRNIILSEYLINYLKTERFIEEARSFAQRAVNQASIKISDLKKIKIPLPPIEKQKEIVAEIEQYQKIIDGAKQVVDNYEPIIKVNREWQEFSLGEICHILNGSTPSKTNDEFWNNGEIPWFTVDDIREQGRIINHTKKFISKTALKRTSVKLLPPKTVLLCCTASVGEYAITEIPLTTNQQFNGLIIKEEYKKIILPEYLFYYSVKFKEELQRLGGTTAFKFVSVKDVKTIKIKVPPIEEQNAIIEKMDFENKTIKTNKELIKIFKQKIKGTISQVWNNN